MGSAPNRDYADFSDCHEAREYLPAGFLFDISVGMDKIGYENCGDEPGLCSILAILKS